MHLNRGIVAFGLFVFTTTPALVASSKKDVSDCAMEDGNKAIAACSRVIQDPNVSNNDRARAYTGRCVELVVAGHMDRAIADCNEAIQLDDKNEISFLARGDAYENKGNKNRAIADYRRAAALGNTSARDRLRKLGVTP